MALCGNQLITTSLNLLKQLHASAKEADNKELATDLMTVRENVQEIREALGTGETLINIEALGPSTLTETAYSGVWWVEHRNVNDEIVGRYVEVTRLPDILSSQPADIKVGHARLEEQFC